LLSEGTGTGHRAHVGGDHHGLVVDGGEAAQEVVHKHRRAQQIVHGDVKEALNLVGVQVHGQHTVGAGPGDQVGHQLGGNGVTGLGLTILTGVAKVGDDGGDAAGRGPLESVDHDQQLHQVVIDGGAGGLNHEHVGATDGLMNGDKVLSIGEGAHLGTAQGNAQVLADGLGQSTV